MTQRDIYKSLAWYLNLKDAGTIKDVYNLDYIVQSNTYPKVIALDGFFKSKIFSNGRLEIYDSEQIIV
jgi:hypothetical protein